MSNDKIKVEVAELNEQVAAHVAKALNLNEPSKVGGNYLHVVVAPVEARRGEYIALRDKIWAAEALLKVTDKASQNLLEMRRELAAIPTYIKESRMLENLVTTVGGNDLLDKYLAGSAYTATWYLGLIGATSFTAVALGDTSASHAGWVEEVSYSQGARPTLAFSAAAAKSKSTSTPAVFSITAGSTITIKGSFLISVNTKSGTTGVLYSAGLFTGGDVAVINGDTLNVTYTATC